MTQWTPEQRQAIETTGIGLLVSAAAGSGKTSVLAERCIHLLCDAPDRCAINELLVVTFTDAAASEMKKRITDRLTERLKNCGEPDARRLRAQLMLIEQANISTLHSFCLRLIRQHFYRLDIDPTVRVIGEDEAALIRSETLKDLFAARYEVGDPAFGELIDAYGDGRDESLMQLVLSTQALMESLAEPKLWRKQALRRVEQGAELRLEESEIGREFLQAVMDDLAMLLRLAEEVAGQLPAEFPKYKAYVEELGREVSDWYAGVGEYDALVERVRNFKPANLPRYSDGPGKKEAQELIERFRNAIKTFRKSVTFSSEQLRAGLKTIFPHAQAFLGLVDEFAEAYQKRKRELGGLDFADQERFALRLLQMPEVAALCHKQFKHVLVDEYQDINSVQEAILTAASCETNLFCVGDVKQSIYRFRLAEPGKFLDKSEAFGKLEGGRRIDLNSNFRSRAKLLEAINGVFRRLMSKAGAEIEYDDSHALNAGADYPDAGEGEFSGSPIELHVLEKQVRGEASDDELDRTQREAMLIARRIWQLMGNDETPRMNVCVKDKEGWKSRPIELSDMVILLRATSHKADSIADVLRQQKIQVYSDRGIGFFDAMEIRDLLSLLALLDNQQQDVPLVGAMRSPLGGFDAEALATIRLAAPEGAFHRAVRAYAEQRNDELAGRLNKFLTELDGWRTLAQRRPLAEVVWKILTDTGYFTFCGGLEDGAQRQANLLHFHQRCKQFGQFGQGLYRFLRFVEELKQEKETARPALTEVDEKAVRIMSIHAAKGLEFPVVFVPDLGKEHNFADVRGNVLVHRREYLGLMVPDHEKQIRYPSLAHGLIRRKALRETLAEELRLLYVAMTRAKEHLILIGTDDLAAIEGWRQRWGNHHGAMPANHFLGGQTILDWLGPATAMLGGANSKMFEIHPHSLADIATWESEQMGMHEFTPRQKQFAELLPIEAPTDPTAERIIAKLGYQYPYEHLTHTPAARSVSEVSKEGMPVPVGLDEEEERMERRAAFSPLRLPRWMQSGAGLEAGEIGTATHRVLQHLKFSRAGSREEICGQMDGMVSRRLLAADDVAAVQVDAILWLMGSPVGELLRKYSERVIRELPIYFACEPGMESGGREGQAGDRVMLRGRLDAAIETEEGLILLDYKTDRVTAEDIPMRAVGYERQIGMYCDALKRIRGKNVVAAYLVFLTPRVLRKI